MRTICQLPFLDIEIRVEAKLRLWKSSKINSYSAYHSEVFESATPTLIFFQISALPQPDWISLQDKITVSQSSWRRSKFGTVCVTWRSISVSPFSSLDHQVSHRIVQSPADFFLFRPDLFTSLSIWLSANRHALASHSIHLSPCHFPSSSFHVWMHSLFRFENIHIHHYPSISGFIRIIDYLVCLQTER